MRRPEALVAPEPRQAVVARALVALLAARRAEPRQGELPARDAALAVRVLAPEPAEQAGARLAQRAPAVPAYSPEWLLALVWPTPVLPSAPGTHSKAPPNAEQPYVDEISLRLTC